MIVEKLLAAFQQAGQRNTRPRRLIAEYLAELAVSGMDFSIDDLWQALRRHDPHLGRATLYRSVEILLQEGFLDRIDFADGTHRYHVCVDRKHCHLTCIRCHCFVEVPVDLPLEQFASIGAQTNFTIEGLSFTLFGRCANCSLQ